MVKDSKTKKVAKKEVKKEVKKEEKKPSVAKALDGDKKKVAPEVKEVVESAADEKEKQSVISQFATRAGDTGSPEVQVAILTWKIVRLQKHLAENTKDNHSRRGLLKIISKRRRIMNYLKKKDEKRYGVLEKKIQGYQKTQ